jgi:hypothetical protein
LTCPRTGGLSLRDQGTPKRLHEIAELKRFANEVADLRCASDIGDMELLLAEAQPAAPTAATGPSRSRLGRLPWIAATGVLTLALIVAGVLLYNATRPAPPRPLIHLNAEIAPDTPLARVAAGGGGGNMLALSPDGTRLALTLRGADGKIRLHTRLLNQGQVTPLVNVYPRKSNRSLRACLMLVFASFNWSVGLKK